MRGLAALVVLASTSCHRVFGIADVPVDAAIPGCFPPVRGSATDDSDDDGVPDSTDNCPTVANMDQHDEDGDCRGDACDLCPHRVSMTDDDTDANGIGDECDTDPPATLHFFDSFHPRRDATAWAAAGAWQDDPSGDSESWVNGTPMAMFPNLLVATAVLHDIGDADTIVHLPASTSGPFDVGFEFRVVKPNPMAGGFIGYQAVLSRDLGNAISLRILALTRTTTQVTTVVATLPVPQTVGLDASPMHFQLRYDHANVTKFTVTIQDKDYELSPVPLTQATIGKGRDGLYTSTPATFDHAWFAWQP